MIGRIGMIMRNFNPRSREGSDRHQLGPGARLPISIHAPVKGATDALEAVRRFYADFNPRSREGSDSNNPRVPHSSDDFNPRSREGSDIRMPLAMTINGPFQSTLP